MSDLTNLLAAAREDATPDTLAVLADCLEEHGDATRAEFIRVQLQLEALDEDDPRCQELRRREQDQRRRYEGVWRGPFFELGGVKTTFRGGLLVVSMGVEGLLEASEEVPVDAPEWHWARSVELTLSTRDSLTDLQCPLLPRVTSLILERSPWRGSSRLSGKEAGRHLRRLAKATTLTRLRAIDAYGLPQGDEWVPLLAGAAFTKQLTGLILCSSGLTSAGVSTLVGALTSGDLRRLDLRWNNLRDQGAAALAAWPGSTA